jgi:hypothetical protein
MHMKKESSRSLPAARAKQTRQKAKEVKEEVEPKPKQARTRTYAAEGKLDPHYVKTILTFTIDFSKRIEKLEAQVAGLAEDNKTSKQLATRLTGLEENIGRFTGALENFLGQIRIDDGLRLVQDNRRLMPVDSGDITLPFDPAAFASIADMDMAYVSESGPVEPDEMSLETDEEEAGDVADIPMLDSPFDGTATTPSEFPDDERIGPVDDVPRVSPIPPVSGRPDADTEMAPPPPPAVNVVPATPQQSQETVPQRRNLLPPPAMSDHTALKPGEVPTRP